MLSQRRSVDSACNRLRLDVLVYGLVVGDYYVDYVEIVLAGRAGVIRLQVRGIEAPLDVLRILSVPLYPIPG